HLWAMHGISWNCLARGVSHSAYLQTQRLPRTEGGPWIPHGSDGVCIPKPVGCVPLHIFCSCRLVQLHIFCPGQLLTSACSWRDRVPSHIFSDPRPRAMQLSRVRAAAHILRRGPAAGLSTCRRTCFDGICRLSVQLEGVVPPDIFEVEAHVPRHTS